MVSSPRISIYTFSIPRGPRDVLTISVTSLPEIRLYICDSCNPTREIS